MGTPSTGSGRRPGGTAWCRFAALTVMLSGFLGRTDSPACCRQRCLYTTEYYVDQYPSSPFLVLFHGLFSFIAINKGHECEMEQRTHFPEGREKAREMSTNLPVNQLMFKKEVEAGMQDSPAMLVSGLLASDSQERAALGRAPSTVMSLLSSKLSFSSAEQHCSPPRLLMLFTLRSTSLQADRKL